jgi:signal transduction histidine kinase
MRESLRLRLLVWSTAILALVVASFAGLVGWLTWQSRLAEIDQALHARLDTLVRSVQPAAAGTLDLNLTGAGESGAGAHYVIWSDTGEVIDESDPDLDVPRPAAPGLRTRAGFRELSGPAAGGALILAGRSLADARAEMFAMAATFGLVGAGAVVVAVGVGWWWIGRALAPIGRISQTAHAMTAGDFSARIPVERVDTELGEVARALNGAFDRLQASLERQRRFAADASHELRTPVTTIATETEWALDRDRSAAEYRQSIEVCRRATTRIQAIVEQLLSLARAESAARDVRRVAAPLDDVVRRAIDDVEPLARRQGIAIDAQLAPVVVAGEPDRLREAITNVIVNAVLYNRADGRVTVVLERDGAWARLRVTDTGIGIPAEDRARVFDPFIRLDPARSRSRGGAGLGLSVTRAVLREHGGDVTAAGGPGEGTVMTLLLPLPLGLPLPPGTGAGTGAGAE